MSIMRSHTTPLTSRCAYCQKTHPSFHCSECKFQKYCSTEHEAADLPCHKPFCDALVKSFNYVEVYEAVLREQIGEDPDLPFDDLWLPWWRALHTPFYIQARYTYIQRLAYIKTPSSVRAQLKHACDCIVMYRHDQDERYILHGLCYRIPHLFLRLDKDRRAYAFVKWLQSSSQLEPRGLFEVDRGYRSTKGVDCLESVDYLVRGQINRGHIVAVALLKVKMILDLMTLQKIQNSALVFGDLPVEIVDKIRSFSVRSPVIRANRKIIEGRDHTCRISMLVKQVKILYNAVHKAHPSLWPTLCNHRKIFKPAFAFDAWMETPGAIDAIRSIAKAWVPIIQCSC